MDWKEKYQALFDRIVSFKYGRPIDFPAIERRVSHLRDGDAIRYDDLETIAWEDLWPFKKYWMWPAGSQSNPLKKAEAYLDTDIFASGYWASRAFERALREECRRLTDLRPPDLTAPLIHHNMCITRCINENQHHD